MAKKKAKDLDPKGRAKKVKGGNRGVNIQVGSVTDSVGKAVSNVGDDLRGLHHIGKQP
jgi:hypothetical protein